MATSRNVSRHRHAQSSIFLAISLSMLIITGILYVRDYEAYSRFFGRANPVLVVIFTIIVGSFLMSRLRSTMALKVYTAAPKTRILVIVVIPLVLFCGIVWVDTRGVFPQDLNIAFPESLLFYPSIAYIVEIIFHIVPFALCVFIITTVFKQCQQTTVLLITIPLVALFEPIFQIMTFGGNYPGWAIAYVGTNILVINLAQLWLFVKYDFVSMYAFRLVYYVLWHIIWGAFRVQWLFP